MSRQAAEPENADAAGVKPSGVQWLALWMLVLSVCINYVDRGNLGVAARSIEADLRFSPDKLGLLLGAFFWTYSLLQIAAGKIVERWNVNWVYAAGYLLWSGATAMTGLSHGFWAIFGLRLLLGAGESVAYPAYSKIIASSFPEQLRGTANGLIDAGSKVGPALGIMIGVTLVNRLSWRGMFLAIGVVSLLWLIPWSALAARLPSSVRPGNPLPSPSYAEILRERAFWGTTIGLFGANFTWYLFLTWLPYYFETARHYQKNELALLGSLPFWAVAASSMTMGLLADKVVRGGRAAGPVRQAFVTSGLIGCCLFLMAAVAVPEELPSNILLCLSLVSMGLFSSNHWAYTQTLSGVSAAGKWTGLENCMGNFAGVLAPYVCGLVLNKTHSFFVVFSIAGAILLMGAAGFSLVVGRAEPVRWKWQQAISEPAVPV